MVDKVVIGNATLYLGDCLEILPTLQKVDAVITDPPYGIGESNERNLTRGKPFGSQTVGVRKQVAYAVDYGAYQWDAKLADDAAIAWCIEAPKAIIWGGNYFNVPPNSKWLIWDKLNGASDFADCELAWTSLPGAVRLFRHMWNGMLRDSEREQRVHPTQKPVALMRWCLQQLGPVNSVVDPYMGSAPVGIACGEEGIAYYGIEKDRRYFDIACERIENAQRQEPLFHSEQPIPVRQDDLFSTR
jgi:DNA modification methylase